MKKRRRKFISKQSLAAFPYYMRGIRRKAIIIYKRVIYKIIIQGIYRRYIRESIKYIYIRVCIREYIKVCV